MGGGEDGKAPYLLLQWMWDKVWGYPHPFLCLLILDDLL